MIVISSIFVYPDLIDSRYISLEKERLLILAVRLYLEKVVEERRAIQEVYFES